MPGYLLEQRRLRERERRAEHADENPDKHETVRAANERGALYSRASGSGSGDSIWKGHNCRVRGGLVILRGEWGRGTREGLKCNDGNGGRGTAKGNRERTPCSPSLFPFPGPVVVVKPFPCPRSPLPLSQLHI